MLPHKAAMLGLTLMLSESSRSQAVRARAEVKPVETQGYWDTPLSELNLPPEG